MHMTDTIFSLMRPVDVHHKKKQNYRLNITHVKLVLKVRLKIFSGFLDMNFLNKIHLPLGNMWNWVRIVFL